MSHPFQKIMKIVANDVHELEVYRHSINLSVMPCIQKNWHVTVSFLTATAAVLISKLRTVLDLVNKK